MKDMTFKFVWMLAAGAVFMFASPARADLVVNADFSRDIVGGTNPGGNPAPVLYAGTGPAPDAGTFWNDGKIPLTATGDQGTDSILHPVLFSDLTASDGTTPTGIDVELTSGFFRAFNAVATPAGDVTALQNDRVFARLGQLATLTIKGLNPLYTYDVYLINSAFVTTYTIGATSKTATGNIYDGAWTEGGEFSSFSGLTPSGSGEIAVGIQDGAAPIDSFGVISGLQIVEVVPEPASMALFGGALLAGLILRRRGR